MIRVDEAEDHRRDVDPRRQIDFHSHLIRGERKPSCLQVFVQAMGAYGTHKYQQDSGRDEERFLCHFLEPTNVWLMVVRRFFGVTTRRSFDLIGRKRTQLCFSRLEERSQNDTNNEDCDPNQRFLHVLNAPYFIYERVTDIIRYDEGHGSAEAGNTEACGRYGGSAGPREDFRRTENSKLPLLARVPHALGKRWRLPARPCRG